MIVVDTSVALQWILQESDTLLAEHLLGRNDLAAPDILLVETANVLAKKIRKSEISLAQGKDGLQMLRQRIATWLPSKDLVDRSLELSVTLVHPVYDCVFLACAMQLGSFIASRDAPFQSAMSKGGFAQLIYSLDP